MSKSTDTTDWTQDDIQDVQQVLPERADFGSLSASHRSALTVDIGLGIQWEEMDGIVEAVRQSLDSIGVPVENIIVTSGYSGSTSSHVLLEIEMD